MKEEFWYWVRTIVLIIIGIFVLYEMYQANVWSEERGLPRPYSCKAHKIGLKV